MKDDCRQKRDLHAFDEHGMVLCNPRDKEAAHRAEMEGIATYDMTAVTCRKCNSLLHRAPLERRDSKASMTSSDSPRQHEGTDVESDGFSAASPECSTDDGGESLGPPPVVGGFARNRDIHSMVAEVRAGDGIDPRDEKRQQLRMGVRKKPDLSSERLARQIFDALCLSSLLSELGLEDFTVTGVTSTGHAGRFSVDVACADPGAKFEPQTIEGILQENKGLFRAEVARAVNRRKAPELQFRVLPPGITPQ